MSDKHSPAPWKEEITEDGDLFVIMGEGHSAFFGNLEETCGTCHANATLTRLAPELLELAVLFVNWKRTGAPALDLVVDKAKMLISQAKGEH